MTEKTVKLTLILALMVAAQSAYSQDLVNNGTFDTDLSGWKVKITDADSVIWYDQAAVFINPGDFPLDDGYPFPEAFSFLTLYLTPQGQDLNYSLMSQTITLPDNADMISFDVTMEVYNHMSIGETDVFTAFVRYGTDFSQSKRLCRLSSTDAEYYAVDPIVDEVDNDGLYWTHHVIDNVAFTFNVAEWADQTIIIEFTLTHDITDDIRTTVALDDVVISVTGDTTPPAVTVGEMMELWPPNHKYRTFNLSDCVLSVGDDNDGQLDIDAAGTILSISSDEPEDIQGKGDGNFMDDIVILGTSSFKVRAERQGAGNGRIYAVNFMVEDAAGNITEATVYLGVPHDQGHDTDIVDDGPESGYIVSAF